MNKILNPHRAFLSGAMGGQAFSYTPITSIQFHVKNLSTAPSTFIEIMGSGDVTIDWGDGIIEVIDSTLDPELQHDYSLPGEYVWTIIGTQVLTYLYYFDDESNYAVFDQNNMLPQSLSYLILYLSNPLSDLNMGTGYTLNNALSYLDLSGSSIRGVISSIPTGIEGMGIGLSPVNINFDTMDTKILPSTLKSIVISSCGNVIWARPDLYTFPSEFSQILFSNCPQVDVSKIPVETMNSIVSISFNNSGLSTAVVDGVINKVWGNKPNYTSPSCNLYLGGDNQAPSGIYQAASPPTTGKEKAYDLGHGNFTPAGPEWALDIN